MKQSLPEKRLAVQESLPSDPLLQGGTQTSELRRWEVVLAYNLFPPSRVGQDFWWLEVLADRARAALDVAREWVQIHPDKNFECTEWVRPASKHRSFVQIPGDPLPLPIQWHVPLPRGWPDSSPIRHPATGIRIGFPDPRRPEDLGLREEGEFALVRHLPASRADLVCLLPVVEDYSGSIERQSAS